MPPVEMPEVTEMPEMLAWQQGDVVSSGFGPLDHLLPRGGVCRGSLIEWLGDDVSGGASLACAVAVSLAAEGGTILVIDRGGRFHPPAVMPWLAADVPSRGQCLVARPSRDDDEAWAIDQALRCPGVAAVLAWPGRIHPTAMRRWQLAARSSRAVGLIVRPARARREPSWAMHRVAVSPLAHGSLTSRRLRLSLIDGPWSIGSGSEPGGERSVEIVIDLVRGREARRTTHLPSQPPHLPQRPPHLFQQPLFQQRGVACRAS